MRQTMIMKVIVGRIGVCIRYMLLCCMAVIREVRWVSLGGGVGLYLWGALL